MMIDQDHPVRIAVIPPDHDATNALYDSHRSNGEYDFQSPSPASNPGLTLDGSQSEGYPSSPDTPSDLGFQNDHPCLPCGSPFLDNLGLWPDPSSPSMLSPAFDFLNLGENGNQTSDDYPDNLKVDQAQQIRTSLSPLTIPPSLNSPQRDYSEAAFFKEYLTDVDNVSSIDNNLLDPLSSFAVDDLSLQQHSQPSPSHFRSNSEVNMPWSGSLSPSVILTPSEPSSSPSLLNPNHATWSADDFTLAGAANLNRRHSHTGVSGRGRGRPEGRSAPSSRRSSRGSSPYERPMTLEAQSAPALGHIGMSISPTQIFSDEMNQLLTVPVPSHFERGHNPRRHSIHMGARPELYSGTELYEPGFWGSGEAGGEAQSPMTPGSTPATPTTPSRALQVASEAGISASQRRRTKVAKFACPTCPQTFTTNHNLKNHINAHLGVKNHQCEHCSRAFTTASVLARHCKTCKSAPHLP